jgi:Membrane bound beta barrel domain (DUF5777)
VTLPLLPRLVFTVALIGLAGAASAQDDDEKLKPAEPDFNLVTLPTSLRLPKYGSAFRVTHRFGRSLNGDFGDVAGDLFGLDSGAVIGLEYRFGIVTNGQIGIHRSSDNKTIEFFGQYGVIRQGARHPLDISVAVSIDGTNNFRDSYSPALGAIISHSVGDRAAFYVEPMWVNNSNPLPTELVDHNNTFMIGIGGRVRIRPTVSIVAETAPRVSGYKPGAHHGSVGIEKRAGGHLFQLNFSDSFGTTWGQLARGGASSHDWYLGFNISRKFF